MVLWTFWYVGCTITLQTFEYQKGQTKINGYVAVTWNTLRSS
jgi:hypothetical protein